MSLTPTGNQRRSLDRMALGARLLLGGLFIYLGASKILHPAEFLVFVRQQLMIVNPSLSGLIVATAPWLEAALNAASQSHFGAPCGYIGQGGTIPLMNMLSQGFPQAQMMICGVLGPKSNAHGPNEFLHVPYAKKLTAAVAQVIAQFP